jgi:hypothetical protein
MKRNSYIYIIVASLLITASCKSTKLPETEISENISSNILGSGPELLLEFFRGETHNHPLMAIWVEDLEGNYIQTLFVAESLGKGIFHHGDATSGKWLPGEIRRPAALPVWSHSRGVEEPDGLFVPTPQKSFTLNTKLDKPTDGKFKLFFEINQTWDWNEYWTNNKYPDDEVYKTSCQPSLIYMIEIDINDDEKESALELVGRGHHAGKDGKIYTDLETMTTALNITRSITVREL